MEENNFKSRVEAFFAGKGFYIVLFVCLAVIGVSAWAMFFADRGETPAADTAAVTVMVPSEPSVKTENKTKTSSADKAEDRFADAVKPEATHKVNEPKAETKTAAKPAPTAEDAAEVHDGKSESGKLTYIRPISGTVTVGYSPDTLIYNKTMADWRTHGGMDIAAQIGEKVMAMADGKVSKVYDDDLFGTTVVIDHGSGLESVYANLAAVPTVKEGDAVTMGSVIGAVGDTALAETAEVSHLHFAVMLNGESADPGEYLPK